MVNLYGTIYYGGASFYAPSSNDIPADLRYYRTNVDGTYVFHWGFVSTFITTSLSNLDWDLQLDTVPTFDSPNLVTFSSEHIPGPEVILNVTPGGNVLHNAVQLGNVRIGFAVPVAPRLDKVDQVWYAHVRSRDGLDAGEFSPALIFVIPQRYEVLRSEELVLSLPDFHVYNQEDTQKPVGDRKTLLYQLMNMYGKELDSVELENLLTSTNNYIDLCRDENLYDNFGYYFHFQRPINQVFVEYRECLRALVLASLVGGTPDAINRVVRSFTGVNPTLILVRDLNDFELNTVQDNPIVPGGPQTVFFTSQPYIAGTLVVEDLTTGLLVPSGNYSTNPGAGSWTMFVPTTDTLQATFDFGAPTDPVPIVTD